jgi:hypothetical protein
MAWNIDPIVLNKSNYAVWAPDMETLLKSKGMWWYMNIMIPDPTNNHAKFVVDGEKDEAVGFITNYISREIHFHLSGINYPHQVWKKLKLLFDQVDGSHIMQLDKAFISLNPHSLDIIEEYLEHVKEIWLKLGECVNNY